MGNRSSVSLGLTVEPEVDVLLGALRHFFGTDGGSFPDRLRQELAWDRLLRLASFHGVVPLLQEATKTMPQELVPREVNASLRNYYLSTAAGNLTRACELIRLVQLFEAAGIPVLSFKGLTLAQSAYGNLGLRGCTDLDILVRRKDYPAVEALLLSDRYKMPSKRAGLKGPVKALTLWVSGQNAFISGSKLWSLDVHTAMMPPGYRYPVQFDTLYERSVKIPLAHAAVATPGPEDLLQVLCLHGIKNRWEAMKHVCDVAAVIRSTPGLDWDAVLAQARRMRGVRILLVGLLMAHELLGIDLPPAVLRQCEADPQIRLIVDHAIQHLLHSHTEEFGYKERSQLHLSIQDNLPNKVRYGFYTVVRRLAEPLQRMSMIS